MPLRESRAFVLTGTSLSARYLTPAALASAALIGLVLFYRAQVMGKATAVAIALLATLVAVNAVQWKPAAVERFPAEDIKAFVQANKASVGYAGYTTASPLTVESDFALEVRPIEVRQGGLGPFFLHRIDSWYRPKWSHRIFIITGTEPAPVPEELGPASTDFLGEPIARQQFGNQIVSVYPGDVTKRFEW